MAKPKVDCNFGTSARADATGVTARVRSAGEHVPAGTAVTNHKPGTKVAARFQGRAMASWSTRQ
jgi:hypothetical protein